MFNSKKIRRLEQQIEYLKEVRDQHNGRLWNLQQSLNLLMDHLRLEFKDNPPSRSIIPMDSNTHND